MTCDLRPLLAAVLSTALLAACSAPRAPAIGTDEAATARAAVAAPAPWALPATEGQQPDLAAAPDGSLLLSWVESEGDAQRLRFARWRGGRWSEPRAITAGEGIGNGADTPHVRQTADGALWATWLRRIGSGHARDVLLARSDDDGRTWSLPVAVNTDGSATEHGFASMWPEGTSSLGVAWLDGRATAGDTAGHHAGHGATAGQGDDTALHHATMLRSAVFDATLARRDETAVDTTTCDCCQTDAVALSDGPRLVYRDRAPGEIRDIAILARGGSGWGAPARVHEDGWRMPGCPVNGPAIAGSGRDVAVAWYTMRGDVPTVRYARSTDAGATFGAPVDLESAPAVLGRVDLALAGDAAWVAWLGEAGAGQVLHAARLDGGAVAQRLDVARLEGRGRGTGWPRIAPAADGMHLVWTEVVGGRPVLRGASISTR